MDLSFLNKLNGELSEKMPLLNPIVDLKMGGSVNRFDSTKEGDNAVWVCIHDWDHKGNIYYRAIYGNWREGVQYTTTSYDCRDATVNNKEFKQKEKAKNKETKDLLEKEKQEKYKYCRDKYAPIYYNMIVNSPVHDYLRGKKISSNFHARINSKNVLFVPAWNSGGLFVGGQRIFLDPETNKFEKKYTYGIEKKGSFCPFGDIRKAEFIYIAEGYATACSIYLAFQSKKNVAVVCVWDTGNILPGAQSIRKVNANSFLIFAADRDINSDPRWHNIGERKAKQAANKLSNSIVKTVKFDIDNDKWSDYNDLHQFEGLDQVARQLHAEATDFIEIIPLGFNGAKYYYFSTSKKQIIEFSKSDHNPGGLTIEAPEKYWGDRFGYMVKQDGTLTNNPNWKRVVEGLGIQSNKKGVFNHSKVRGVGAWELNKEMLVNIGDKLYHRGEFFPLFNNGIKSDYFHQSSESISLDFGRPIGNSDALKIVEAFQLLRYKSPSDFIIVLGWIFSAQIFAALPWRPHIWFTGPRGSGKSTILNYVADIIDFSIFIQDSTAAGIRQKLLNNAIAVIYDESEPNTDRDRERMAEIMAMARQSSTRSKYEVLRGSASGRAVSYNTNTTFCMGSIQLADMNPADTSRFFIIEMDSIKEQTHEEFVRLENAMADVRNLSSGLFVRAVGMYENHIKNIETAKQVIRERKIESRQADQLAPVIAGYYAYFDTGEMPRSFVVDTIREMDFEKSDYVVANDENESSKCFEDILSLQIPSRAITVGQIVDRYRHEHNRVLKDEYDQLLGMIGIRFLEVDFSSKNRSQQLFISTSNSALKKLMEKFSRFSDFKNVLKRHEKFVEIKKIRVAGSPIGGIVLSIG